MEKFKSLGLTEESIQTLIKLGFENPTTIQKKAIQPMLSWRDVLAQAPTGTGKTCAFGLPIIEHIKPEQKNLEAVILAPTRELAIQIGEDLRQFSGARKYIKVSVLYGGSPIEKQITELKNNPHIIVATPGRLIDHLQRGKLQLNEAHTVVLDEADRMLDMGFVDDVRKIMDAMPKVPQIALFSATLSRSVMDISWLYQRDPVEIYVAEAGEDKPFIDEFYIIANGSERIEASLRLILSQKFKKVIFFTNMKQSAEILTRKLKDKGLEAASLHGDISQDKREKVLKRFKNNQLDILVATDVAARGIDVDDVDAVFNYDLPHENEHYVHRIGRTGRANKKGVAYAFVAPGGEKRLDEISKAYGEIKELPFPERVSEVEWNKFKDSVRGKKRGSGTHAPHNAHKEKQVQRNKPKSQRPAPKENHFQGGKKSNPTHKKPTQAHGATHKKQSENSNKAKVSSKNTRAKNKSTGSKLKSWIKKIFKNH